MSGSMRPTGATQAASLSGPSRGHRPSDLTPPIDFAEVEQFILGLRLRYRVRIVTYDRFQLADMCQRLERAGFTMREIKRTELMPMAQALYDVIHFGQLDLYADTSLREALTTTRVIRKATGGMYFRKDRHKPSTNDITQAMAMSVFASRLVGRHHHRLRAVRSVLRRPRLDAQADRGPAE
jgi:hypothetical protein